jgi:DNA-binding transcriptional LysR family regulator
MDPVPPLRDIRCFALVARHRGFSAAAAELGLSQPAISQAIRRLERSLDLQLFERTSRDVRLSAAGAALLPHAEALLAQAADFAATAARLAAPPRPSITLAYPSLLGSLAARTARRLARREPGIDVTLRPAGSRAAVATTRDAPSAAILTAPVPAELTSIPLLSVAVGHLAVADGDPLAGRRVGPDTLPAHRLLVPATRPPGGLWHRLAVLAGDRALRPVADDIDDWAAALDLVAAGLGVLPAPSLLVATLRRPDIRYVPLDVPDLALRYRLAWRADAPTPELLALVQAVQQVLRTR